MAASRRTPPTCPTCAESRTGRPRKLASAKAAEREQANQEHRKELEAAGHYFGNHKPAFTAERDPQRPVRPFLSQGGVA